MNKILFTLTHFTFKLTLFFGLFLVTTSAAKFEAVQSQHKKIFMGTIKFPHTISKIPTLRIYCEGHIIPCETNHETKGLAFSILQEGEKDSFNLLITNEIHYKTEKNTILYLYINPSQPYLFYHLTLNQNNDDSTDPETTHKTLYSWTIQEHHDLLENGKIPDDTIIVYCNPEFIETVKGGTQVSLPTIIIRNDILQITGSEEKLHDILNELLLSSLHCDAIHARVQQEIKPNYQQKTIVALAT